MRKTSRATIAAFMGAASGAHAQSIVDPGFETAGSTGLIPDVPGVWGIDPGSSVGPTLGVTPLVGDRMLRFEGTLPVCTPPFRTDGIGGDVGQIVDLSAFADLIATGRAVARFSMAFNRVAGDADTDTEFGVFVNVLDGDPSTFPIACDRTRVDFLASAQTRIITDGDPSTWERAEVQLALPPGATFLTVTASAIENVLDGARGSEFDGHFADDGVLVVEPSDGPFLYSVDVLAGTLVRIDATTGIVDEVADYPVDGLIPDINQDLASISGCLAGVSLSNTLPGPPLLTLVHPAVDTPLVSLLPITSGSTIGVAEGLAFDASSGSLVLASSPSTTFSNGLFSLGLDGVATPIGLVPGGSTLDGGEFDGLGRGLDGLVAADGQGTLNAEFYEVGLDPITVAGIGLFSQTTELGGSVGDLTVVGEGDDATLFAIGFTPPFPDAGTKLYAFDIRPDGTLALESVRTLSDTIIYDGLAPVLPCVIDFEPDCVLDIFDFLAFLNLFTSGDPAADLDANGILNLFDFLAFQTRFAAGCE
ncbi:MAG: GC-type dockerin domain-anchored protein [Planctomycetota bacterium]